MVRETETEAQVVRGMYRGQALVCRNVLCMGRGGSRALEQSDKGQCLREVSLVLPWWHGWP